jgi:diguanylate cyclase (GGDEF)-like protein
MIDLKNEQFSGMKVLLVDDTPENLDILGHILKGNGLIISVAPNGEIALKIATQNTPDLILLDIMMPDMDGYEVCKRLKQNKATQEMPIIFISAMAELGDIVKGFKIGGADYVVKPFREEEVLVRINTQLSLRKLLLEKNELIEELDSLSRIDPLTKVSNRRDIMEKLEGEQSRFERYGKCFSVIMCDIDYFKKVNDLHGHDAGDYVLKQVAMLLRKHIRELDKLSRWGGEEFLIVLPETSLAGAANAAEKMRRSIESYSFEYSGAVLKTTMSFGVSCHANSGVKLEDLLKTADEYLYQAKNQGRNRVISI